MNNLFFIFGFGYTAQFLAPKLTDLGYQIIGTKRAKPPNHSAYTLIDFNDPKLSDYLSKATHLLISIPPTEAAGDLVLAHYADLIKHHGTHIKWIGYLSSTGVYGDHKGKWVDESTQCNPQSPSGVLRLKAEHAWTVLAAQLRIPLTIFRLAGIYGPGRNALERIIAGKKYSIYKEGHFFSRIHVEDITSVIMASIQHPQALSIYNVADDEPAPSHIVDAYASQLLDQKPLALMPFAEASLSAAEYAFYSSNRRVANTKIKNELNIVLKYPSFREGLFQCNS